MKKMKGAEAVLRRVRALGNAAVEKFRPRKEYRAGALDGKIRRERTRREARLLARAKKAGVLCPVVYEVSDFAIRMKFLKGKMLYHEMEGRAITRREITGAARILAALHSVDVVHGDFTPANLMLTPGGMAVIDFGLGSISPDAEDKGTDVLTMKKALATFSEVGRRRTTKMKKALGAKGAGFVSAYAAAGGRQAVVRMARQIESRARYMERG
ncbi:MAG: KEOPS complex kinase/ATPase Bud32 [Candidatus Micrarchaeia archaeon]|jgi:N6-L-threonylcarbamoyladenine synthase/protein kinase Bud32